MQRTIPVSSRRAIRPVLLGMLAMPFISGCGTSDRPQLGSVSGIVRFQGQPLARAVVRFTPDGPGRTSIGTTGSDGRYELTYLRDIMGANIGRHVVRISTATEDNGRTELLPDRYHTATTLEAVVESGHNTIDFALEK